VGEGSGVAVGGTDVGTTADAEGLAGRGAEQLTPSADVQRTNQATARTGLTLRMAVVGENVGTGSGIAGRRWSSCEHGGSESIPGHAGGGAHVGDLKRG
jgi:hypothetical protein